MHTRSLMNLIPFMPSELFYLNSSNSLVIVIIIITTTTTTNTITTIEKTK